MNANGFKNGAALSSTGQRQVLFNNAGALRPVLMAIESGYKPERGTVQVPPRAGDLIARVEWNRHGAEYELARVAEDGDSQGVPLSWNERAALWARLKEQHSWLNGWLAPVERSPSFLPTEAWGGESIAARSKRERIEAAIRRFGLPCTYSSKWAISPKAGINTTARPLDFLPNKYQAEARSWTGSVVGINCRERFFSSAGNGTPAVELFPALKEEHGSNWAHEETVYQKGQPGIPGWAGQQYLVRLVDGAYTRDHHSYGMRIDVWDTTQVAVAVAAQAE